MGIGDTLKMYFEKQPVFLQQLEEHAFSGFLIGFGGALSNNIVIGANFDQLKVGLTAAIGLGFVSLLRSVGTFFMTGKAVGTAGIGINGHVEARSKLLF